MWLSVVLKKEVPDVETAQSLADIVADKVKDIEGVTVWPSVSDVITLTTPPPQ